MAGKRLVEMILTIDHGHQFQTTEFYVTLLIYLEENISRLSKYKCQYMIIYSLIT
jgi:hypothetical protein